MQRWNWYPWQAQRVHCITESHTATFVTSVRFFGTQRAHASLQSRWSWAKLQGLTTDMYSPPSVVRLTSLSPDKSISMTHCHPQWTSLGNRVAACPHPFCRCRLHCTVSTIRLLHVIFTPAPNGDEHPPERHLSHTKSNYTVHFHIWPRFPYACHFYWLYGDKVRLWNILAAVWRQRWPESACYMVKSKVVWWHFT